MLKVQLKKYVGAVQMLKREGQTAEGEGQREPGGGGGAAPLCLARRTLSMGGIHLQVS